MLGPDRDGLAGIEGHGPGIGVAALVGRAAGAALVDQAAGRLHRGERGHRGARGIHAEMQDIVVRRRVALAGRQRVAGRAVQQVADGIAEARGAGNQGQAVVAFRQVGVADRGFIGGRAVAEAGRRVGEAGDAVAQQHVAAVQAAARQVFVEAEGEALRAGAQHGVFRHCGTGDHRLGGVVVEGQAPGVITGVL